MTCFEFAKSTLRTRLLSSSGVNNEWTNEWMNENLRAVIKQNFYNGAIMSVVTLNYQVQINCLSLNISIIN